MTKTQKTKAIELMKQLDIYKPYIDGFDKEDKVCFFEQFAGFWVDQESELYKKMQTLEKEYGLKVYAITHDYADFGEMYSFLIVPKNPDEWDELVYSNGKSDHYVFAYVWNKSDDNCSEFGSVAVKSFGGGIRRYA